MVQTGGWLIRAVGISRGRLLEALAAMILTTIGGIMQMATDSQLDADIALGMHVALLPSSEETAAAWLGLPWPSMILVMISRNGNVCEGP